MSRLARFHINLEHLDTEVLALVPDYDGRVISGHAPTAGAVFSTRWRAKNSKKLATAVAIEITLPRPILRPNFSLGTIVLAAAQVGLELVLTELANAGLPKSALDMIGIKHVSLTSVFITYMLPFAHAQFASQFKRLIRQHGLLLGLIVTSIAATNRTEYRVPRHPGTIPPNGHLGNSELAGVTVSIDRRSTQKFVYVDVILENDYLKRKNWDDLGNWDGVRTRERYESIFNQAVRGMLRLDGGRRPHPEVYCQ